MRLRQLVWMWAGAAVGTLAAGCSDGPLDPLVENANVPARIVVVVGDAQTGVLARALADDPAVRVENDAGAGIGGVTVRFTVVQGDGTIEFGTAVSDSNGVASGGAWTLGALPGENRLQVSVAALASVEIVALAESPYSIETRILGTITSAQRAALDAAVERWQSVIVSELDDVALTSAANSCFQGQPAISENVDDLVIFVEFTDIDGVGGVLGQAGPCYVRSQGTLPIMGFLQLDAKDLAQLELSGMLGDVVLHEIGHVIGIGTIWPDLGLLAGAGGADPVFTGAGAISAYRMVGGLGASVPVENTGSAGTRDGHWRESILGNELMTGYLSALSNPLSAVTIASLQDMGYSGNATAAAAYHVGITGTAPSIDLHGAEVLVLPRYRVDANGIRTGLDP